MIPIEREIIIASGYSQKLSTFMKKNNAAMLTPSSFGSKYNSSPTRFNAKIERANTEN